MPKKVKFDPRKLMELAVKVMKGSLQEPRQDGKVPPKVGAVLWMPAGNIDTASRGELRHGDHAEYTLLERKHRDEKLDGSVLFATLEPCAPGARKHPKSACSQHIVNARIAEVWVGIEDPDPTVDRQGIQYLEKNGIRVRLFDRDLQEQIRKENRKFIEQAFKRAAEAKGRTTVKSPPLSQWDEASAGAGLADLSSDALTRYRDLTKMPDKVMSAGFLQRLEHQGLLRRRGSKLAPTGFGFLLFGKTPRDVLHHTGLNATIQFPDGTHEIRNFDGPTILIPELVESWLRPKLPNIVDRSRMTREERPAMPFELIREAVVNALVHRDYDLTGAICHITVTPDTVTVRSPGMPLVPVTVEQMQAFTAPMYNRNPKLQYAFGGAKLVEGRGFGMRTFGEAAAKHQLPVPKYKYDGLYLNLTIYRHAKAAVQALGNKVLEKLSKSEQVGWEWLASKGIAKSSEYANAMKMDDRTARRHLKHFEKLRLVRVRGIGPSTRYQIKG